MTYTCCVPGCNTTGSKIFHSFPKNKLQCKRWIHDSKCFNLSYETAYKTHHKVCKIHFKPDDYTSSMLKYLKSNVVPSLHLPKLDVAGKYLSLKNVQNTFFEKVAVPFETESEVVENLENCANVENVLASSSAKEVVIKNLEICENVVNVPSSSSAKEVVIKNLEICVDGLNKNNRVFPDAQTDSQIGVRVGCPKETLNCAFGVNLPPLDVSNKHLAFTHAIREPYLTDDVEDNEFYINNNQTASERVTIPPPYIIDLNNVLVPKMDQISNPMCDKTDRKTKIGTSNYDPAARRARYQATRIKFLTLKLRNSESLQKSKILDYLEKKLDPNQMTFVRMQIKNAGKRPRGHRFTFEEKCMAFAVYKQSPKCYRQLLSKILTLPCKQTLMKHSALVRFEAGINTTLMTFLSDVVKEMHETDKIVTLGWDEMSLSAHLDFCKVKDYIDGFVDNGKITCDEFATHALVFMVRGAHKSYKQPISYFLTQNISKDELAELITLVTEAVMDVGLKIIGSVCDAVSTNLGAVRQLMEPKMARLPKFCVNMLEYRIRNASIIHFFDPPHLIKTIRNNMLTKD